MSDTCANVPITFNDFDFFIKLPIHSPNHILCSEVGNPGPDPLSQPECDPMI